MDSDKTFDWQYFGFVLNLLFRNSNDAHHFLRVNNTYLNLLFAKTLEMYYVKG